MSAGSSAVRYDLSLRRKQSSNCACQSVRYSCFEIEEVTKKRGKERIFELNLEQHEKIMANH